MPAAERKSSRYERNVTDVAMLATAEAALDEPCAACGGTRATARYAIDGIAARLVTCSACGTGRLYPMPSADEIASFYPSGYYGDLGTKFARPIELLVRLVAARKVSFLTEGLAPGARVLDVGCGRGVTLGTLADRGIEAHGFEISAEAALGADPRARIRVAPALEQAGYPDAHFDAVVIWHVLEHVRDPRRTLETVLRIAKPGARLVVAVPNFSSPQARWAGPGWFHLDLPRHLHHFPLAALRSLLERTGFAVRSEHHFSLRQNPFGWIQSWQNRRTELPRNGLYTLLYRRSASEAAPFDARTRRRILAGFALAAGPALAAAAIEAALRRGSTVHLVASPR